MAKRSRSRLLNRRRSQCRAGRITSGELVVHQAHVLSAAPLLIAGDGAHAEAPQMPAHPRAQWLVFAVFSTTLGHDNTFLRTKFKGETIAYPARLLQ
jgi:hypothetical protein